MIRNKAETVELLKKHGIKEEHVEEIQLWKVLRIPFNKISIAWVESKDCVSGTRITFGLNPGAKFLEIPYRPAEGYL